MESPPSIQALQQSEAPFVLADQLGNVVAVNAAFERVYGWSWEELVGRPVTLILPEAFRMSHQLGFSRYQSTRRSEVLGHPLRLKTVCRDGSEVISEHFIVAEQWQDGWRFGATLTPLGDGPTATAPTEPAPTEPAPAAPGSTEAGPVQPASGLSDPAAESNPGTNPGSMEPSP